MAREFCSKKNRQDAELRIPKTLRYLAGHSVQNNHYNFKLDCAWLLRIHDVRIFYNKVLYHRYKPP